MKTPGERGPIGAWAYEARAEADLSVEQVADRLSRAGQPVTASTLRGIEGGSKRPSRRLLRALAQVYGKQPPGEAEPPPADAVAAAMQSQADAINRLAAALEGRERSARQWEATLVRALRISMEERRGQGEEVLERLGELATALGLEGTPIADGLDTPERAN